MSNQSDNVVCMGGSSCFSKQSLIFVASSSSLVVVAILSLRSVAISDMNMLSGSMTMVLSSSSVT